MALATDMPFELHENLLRQLQDELTRSRKIDETRMMIHEYELRYGIASEFVHEAIDSGQLQEDFDVCQWLIQLDLLAYWTESRPA